MINTYQSRYELFYKLFRYLLIGCIPLITLFCSPKLKTNTKEAAIYPTAPDKPRIQYLTSFSTSHDIEKPPSFLKKFVAGEELPKPIIKPYGIFVKGTKMYVCDLDLKGLEIIDLKEQTFQYFIPKGLGQLKLPINCFMDSLNYLYVADANRRQVVVFNEKLEYVTEIGGKEDFKPTDVFVAEKKIWISDIKNAAVDVYRQDSSYQYLYSLPNSDQEDGIMRQPTNLYVTKDKVYVSDFGDFRIKMYDHKGTFISSVGSYGRGVGQFTRPKGVAIDRNENLYVVDAAFENIQIFNKEGKILMFFGGSTKEPGGMWLPAKVNISYDNLELFQRYVDKKFNLLYLIFVTNNFGPHKINVYGRIDVK